MVLVTTRNFQLADWSGSRHMHAGIVSIYSCEPLVFLQYRTLDGKTLLPNLTVAKPISVQGSVYIP